MAARLRGLLDRLLARRREAAEGVSDAELLLRYTRERDEAAFELLVWRHGAMVLGLCRRAVRDEQLAEDAFQAVFLVLARKAGAVRGNLGGWLFKVARRVAARASARQPIVQPVSETPAPTAPDPVAQNELSALLDDEIARLPERLRRAVVLCYLGGRSTEDAARELGCPRGTVLSRLATARKRLAARLTRRGVTLPTTLGVATVGNRLVSSASASAPAFRNGALTLSTATQLADGVLRSMIRTTIITATAGVVLAATLVTGVGWVAAQQGTKSARAAADAPTDPPAPAKTAPEAPKPQQPDPAHEAKTAADRLKKLEQLADALKAEIEAREKVIELLAKDREDSAARAALLQKRLAEMEAELAQVERDIARLEAEVSVLKKRLDGKPAAPDPALVEVAVEQNKTYLAAKADLEKVKAELARAAQLVPVAERNVVVKDLREKVAVAEKNLAEVRRVAVEEAKAAVAAAPKAATQQRVTELGLTIEINKEIRDKLKSECETLRKQVAQVGKPADLDAVRKDIEPQRELLARLQREILFSRAKRDGITFTEATGTDAKLDAVLRELASLRKEVQELKELAKKPK